LTEWMGPNGTIILQELMTLWLYFGFKYQGIFEDCIYGFVRTPSISPRGGGVKKR
jgi:hypothetical protein